MRRSDLKTSKKKTQAKAYAFAAIAGGIAGVFLSVCFWSLPNHIQFEFDRVYKFELPLLASTTERAEQIQTEASRLRARGIFLNQCKALLDHGLEGALTGAALGVGLRLAYKQIRSRFKQVPSE